MPQRDDMKVAVIGAGPVGLAAAAHLLERGLTPIVLEAGPAAGDLVRQWSHVCCFLPGSTTSTRLRNVFSTPWVGTVLIRTTIRPEQN